MLASQILRSRGDLGRRALPPAPMDSPAAAARAAGQPPRPVDEAGDRLSPEPTTPPSTAPSRRLAYACVVAAACLWGTLGTGYRLVQAGAGADALTVVTLRAAAAALLLWGALALIDRSALRVAPRDLPRFAGFGLSAVTVQYLALFLAFDRTTVAVGTVLLYLAPAVVAVGAAAFLAEPLTRRKLLALGVTLGGCLFVVELYRPQNLAGDGLGIAFGLVAAAAYGSYSLFAKPLLGRYRATTVLAYALLPGAAGLLLVKLLASPTDWPAPAGLLAIAGYYGVVATIAPFGLYTLALRALPSGEASILATLEPVVAAVLAGVALGEWLAPLQLFGVAMILGGVVLLARPGGLPAVPGNPARRGNGGRRPAPIPVGALVAAATGWRHRLTEACGWLHP